MKIRLRISPVHLYFVTPSDKSFLLWKRILWCIIWFSLWKWPFILYDSCYSRGASAPFHFMVGSSSGRRESETLGSLWITHSKNQTSPKPIIYVVIWIYDCWSTVNPIKVHEPLVSLASPRFRALPPTTNIEQTLLLSLKPRLILYSNESCHTSRADTVCAVSL